MKAKSNFYFFAFIATIILLIVSLQYNFWFSNTGLLKYKTLKIKVAQQQVEEQEKELNNQKLYSEVVSLRENNEVLESLARESLGYVKNKEVFYSVEK